MIRSAIRRAVRGAMKFAMNSNTPRYEQIVTGNVIRAMADRVYLDASASSTSDIYNNTHQLAITGGTGSGQSSLVNDYVVDSVTNELLYSEQFDNAFWSVTGLLPFGGGSNINAITAPDGTLSMDEIVEDTSTNVHRNYCLVSGISRNVEVSYSVYVKQANGTRNIAIQLTDSGINYCYSTFNLVTEQMTLFNSGNALISKVEMRSFGNGIYRCSITGKVNTTDPTTGFSVYNYIANNGSNNYTGDGTSGLYLWGAQININGLQEYVPTIATTVTETVRVAHVSSDFTTIPQGPADSTYTVNKILGVP